LIDHYRHVIDHYRHAAVRTMQGSEVTEGGILFHGEGLISIKLPGVGMMQK